MSNSNVDATVDQSRATAEDWSAAATIKKQHPARRRWIILGTIVALVLGFLWWSAYRYNPLVVSLGSPSAVWTQPSSVTFKQEPSGLGGTYAVLTSPKPGTNFGSVVGVSNYSDWPVKVRSVTSDWTYAQPQIVSGHAVYTKSLPDPLQSNRPTDVAAIPPSGVTVAHGKTVAVGQEFTIPACAVNASSSPTALAAMHYVYVRYSFLWFTHDVGLPVSASWAIRAPYHC